MLWRAFLAALWVLLCGDAHAADIVFSGAADLGNVTSTSLSAAYVVGSGNNRALVACVFTTVGDSITATYGGVSMSGPVAVDTNQTIELFYLLNPASGSNTLVVTDNTASSFIQVIAADYYNVAQLGQPDGTGISDDTIAEDTFSGHYTTSQAGASVVACASNQGNGTAPSVSGVNFTLRTYAAQFGDTLIADHGPKRPAGGVTLTATIHNGGFMQGQSFISLLPTACGSVLALMRVGC